MSIKGYPNQEKDDRLKAQFATIEPVREKQFGLSSVTHQFAYEAALDSVEANSTVYILNLTAHAVLVGDIIRFTSGALSGQEVKVASIPDANSIELAENLSVAPSAADTIQVLRHKYPVVNADGTLPVSLTAAPIQFVRNGVDTEVEEDTVTPANNRPLPVKLTDFSGDMILNAANLNLEVQLDHDSATPDSIQIGDGVEIMAINASNEAQVRDDDAITELTIISGDTTSLDTKIPAQGQAAMAASLPVVIASDQSPVKVDDDDAQALLTTIDADTSSIDSKTPALGQAAMAASVPVVIASDQSVIKVDDDDTQAILTTIDADTGSIDSKTPALGQAASAASVPVVLASDQSAISVVQGLTQREFIRNDYTGTNVTTGAYVELIASLAFAIKEIEIFDSSGETLKLALGAAAS